MQQRLDWYKAAPDAYKAMAGLEAYLARTELEPAVKELVKIRASQLNGCAFCLDMHTADARKHGESDRRIAVLPAWREVTWFNARERAALGWTEVLTRLTHGAPSEADFAAVREVFNDKEIADLTLLVAAINAWNRFGVGFAMQPPALG